MNLKEIKELIEVFNKSELSKLNIKNDTFEIKLNKNINQTAIAINPSTHQMPQQNAPLPSSSQPTEAPQAKASTSANSNSDSFITSPMVGTFYQSPSPSAAPFVKVGDTIKKGQTIGIVEAMKIMNEIQADFDCKIVSIEAENGQPVEFGTNLIKVERV